MKQTVVLILSLFISMNSFAHGIDEGKRLAGDASAFATDIPNTPQGLWPFEILSIGHSMQSYQSYMGSPYWHDGLDLIGYANQNIYSTVSGKVVNIENYRPGNELYWEVAVLDDLGFVWKFHHVDSTTIPSEIHAAFKKGSRIKAGQLLGQIVDWPSSAIGEPFHHIHMLVVDGLGRYINPFLLLPKLDDRTSPTIGVIGLTKNLKRLTGSEVEGPHGLFAEISDTVLNPKFLLTPFKISYRYDGGNEQVVWKFDYLPSLTNDRDFINAFYLGGSCGDYQCRRFYINLSFDPKAPQSNQQINPTPGRHEVEVIAEDFVGNRTSKIFQYLAK